MRCLVVTIALACCAPALAAPAASLELREDVGVSGDTVTLGDVARIESRDLSLIRALVDLPVGSAPPLGQVSRVRRDALLPWLQRQDALTGAVLTWSGADGTRLVRQGLQVEGRAVGEAALAELRKWMAASGVAGDAAVATTPRDAHVAAPRVRLQARPVQAAHLRRRMIVWVDLWSEGIRLRTIPVTLDVQSDASPLQGGAGGPKLPTQWGEVPGKAGKQERPLAVERGTWAALRSVTGAVVLESRVQVLQDGRTGERVRVRQQGATGIVFARVVERGVLELAP